MYDTIPTKDMSREDWLKIRKAGIGGSDAGAVCGVNPYTSAMDIYYDKVTDDICLEDSEAMRQGRELENYVAERFCEATGFKVRRSNKMYRSTEYPFMIADVDRFVVGQDAGLECKTASAYNGDKWKDGRIPPHYLVQCLHYMAVTGKRAWYIAVVILGVEFKYVRIDWDEQLIENLIQVEKEFWNRHIIPGVLPAPDGSEACDRILDKYFRKSGNGPAIRLEGFDEKLARREELERQIKGLEKEQKQIDQEIKLYMKDCEAAFNDSYRITWKSVESLRLDTARLKKEIPETYRDFSNVRVSRPFKVKAA